MCVSSFSLLHSSHIIPPKFLVSESKLLAMNLKLSMNHNYVVISFILPKDTSYSSTTTLTLKLIYFSLLLAITPMDSELKFFLNSIMNVATTWIVKDDGDVVGSGIPKVALLVSSTFVFPSIVAIISHLSIPWLEVFQTECPCPTKLSPLFQN